MSRDGGGYIYINSDSCWQYLNFMVWNDSLSYSSRHRSLPLMHKHEYGRTHARTRSRTFRVFVSTPAGVCVRPRWCVCVCVCVCTYVLMRARLNDRVRWCADVPRRLMI